MRSYRVVLFVDVLDSHVELVTDDVNTEVEHMIRLYNDDEPVMQFTHSSTAPVPEAT